MSDLESVMWSVEKDPALRSDFTNLTILDTAPDPARLMAMVERMIAAMPRLDQRVKSTPLHIAPPRWEDDPQLNLEYHIRRVAIPPPGSMRALFDAAAQLAATPFDRQRPLWEFTLLEGLEGGRAGFLQKLHHTITDGVGGIKLSAAMIDFERNPPDVADLNAELRAQQRHDRLANPIPQTSFASELWSGIAAAASTQIRRTRSVVGAASTLATHPQHVPNVGRSLWNMVNSVQRQVVVGPRGYSRLFAPRSLGRRYDVLSVPFDQVKQASKAHGVTVNDVFVYAMSRGIAAYHAAFGETLEHLRMAMPVNLRNRPGQHGANAFAPVRIVLPVSLGDLQEGLAATHDTLKSIRQEPALEALGSIAGAAGMLPTSALISLTRQQTKTIDFATSNLRGASMHLFMAGARIERTIPLGPRTNAPLNITVMSYAGAFEHGIHSDPAAITDPELLVRCIEEAWNELLAPHRKSVTSRNRQRGRSVT